MYAANGLSKQKQYMHTAQYWTKKLADKLCLSLHYRQFVQVFNC